MRILIGLFHILSPQLSHWFEPHTSHKAMLCYTAQKKCKFFFSLMSSVLSSVGWRETDYGLEVEVEVFLTQCPKIFSCSNSKFFGWYKQCSMNFCWEFIGLFHILSPQLSHWFEPHTSHKAMLCYTAQKNANSFFPWCHQCCLPLTQCPKMFSCSNSKFLFFSTKNVRVTKKIDKCTCLVETHTLALGHKHWMRAAWCGKLNCWCTRPKTDVHYIFCTKFNSPWLTLFTRPAQNALSLASGRALVSFTGILTVNIECVYRYYVSCTHEA